MRYSTAGRNPFSRLSAGKVHITMVSVAAYCRVSTDREEQHLSFTSQQTFFREYIASKPDWMLYELYADEGITGTSTQKRGAFQRMIRDAHLGKFQRILTKEVSRFSRNIVDTLLYTRELKAIGVTVLFLTENLDTSDPKSEMLLSFMATLAQEESRRTGARVTWGQQRQMENGVVFGRSLLGYDVIKGKLKLEPEGAALVKLIFQKYTLERMSTSQLSRYLEGEGYRTSTGNSKWSQSHILKILKNEKYVGDLIQRKSYTPDYLTHQKKTNHGQVPVVEIKNHHEAIIDRTLWEKTQQRLQSNDKHSHQAFGHSNRYLFSGKIKCGVCGAAFVSRTKKQRDGTIRRYWCCATAVREGKQGCDIGCSLRDEDGRQMMRIALSSLDMDRTDILNRVTRLARQSISTGEYHSNKDLGQLQSALRSAQERRERMLDAYFSGEISKPDMLALKERYEKNIQSIQQKMTVPVLSCVELDCKPVLEAILKGENECEILYKVLLDQITIYRDRRMELRFCCLNPVFLFEQSKESDSPLP